MSAHATQEVRFPARGDALQRPLTRGQPRVLVVDDAPDNLDLIATVLMREGYEVYAADSGLLALDLVAEVKPDLILLDLMMPGVCGIETCRRLKQRGDTATIPVVILTACSDDRQLLESFAVGAVDFVRKPFNPPILLARVRTHVQLYRRSCELERLARIDALTDLPNRGAFDDRLNEEWLRARRSGTGVGLVLLDVDCFKQYNDHYGHTQGDIALQRVATALESLMRRAGDFCARYGGEEFVVLASCADGCGIAELAARVGETVRELAIPHLARPDASVLTVSSGYASVIPNDDIAPLDLVNAADQALYRAKANGRDRAEAGLIDA